FLAYYSGSRPTVVWAILSSSVRRFVSWLTGDPAAAATISASKVAAATVATAAIGAAAGAAPVPVVHHPPRPLAAHSARTHSRGAAASLHRRGAAVIVPASAPAAVAQAATPSTASVKPGRAAAHHSPLKPGHGHK